MPHLKCYCSFFTPVVGWRGRGPSLTPSLQTKIKKNCRIDFNLLFVPSHPTSDSIVTLDLTDWSTILGIVIARIRRMTDRNVFTLSTISGGGWGGTPSHRSVGGGGYPVPGLDGGGYPSQVWMVEGGYPSQVWMVEGTPARSGWGGTPARSGWWKGTPPPRPGLDGGRVPPPPPARSGWWTGTPPLPHHDWMGYQPPPPHPPTHPTPA